MEGARVLTSRWILFADADTRFEPGFVEMRPSQPPKLGKSISSRSI